MIKNGVKIGGIYLQKHTFANTFPQTGPLYYDGSLGMTPSYGNLGVIDRNKSIIALHEIRYVVLEVTQDMVIVQSIVPYTNYFDYFSPSDKCYGNTRSIMDLTSVNSKQTGTLFERFKIADFVERFKQAED